MVRYGILGFGLHGWKRLVPAFAGAKNSKLTGIGAEISIRRRPTPAITASKQGSLAQELCASPEVDAVFVTSPDALHMRDSLMAISHRKAVLCEKPLAMSVAEVEQMLAHAKKANVQFGVAQNFRYNRSVDLIREWVEAGRIGQTGFRDIPFLFSECRQSARRTYDPSLARGGPIGDVGIHCLDVLRYILQDNVTAVTTLAHRDANSGAWKRAPRSRWIFTAARSDPSWSAFAVRIDRWLKSSARPV